MLDLKNKMYLILNQKIVKLSDQFLIEPL